MSTHRVDVRPTVNEKSIYSLRGKPNDMSTGKDMDIYHNEKRSDLSKSINGGGYKSNQ